MPLLFIWIRTYFACFLSLLLLFLFLNSFLFDLSCNFLPVWCKEVVEWLVQLIIWRLKVSNIVLGQLIVSLNFISRSAEAVENGNRVFKFFDRLQDLGEKASVEQILIIISFSHLVLFDILSFSNSWSLLIFKIHLGNFKSEWLWGFEVEEVVLGVWFSLHLKLMVH